MGFLKMMMNANNAEGIREAMRITYKKATGSNMLHDIELKRHQIGMMLTLKTRNMTYGTNESDEEIMVELAPFNLIDSQEKSLDALIEYVVYKEKPIEARVEGLKRILCLSIKNSNNSDYLKIASIGLATKKAWFDLLDDESLITLKKIREKYYN
jgi:hypothetical protein